MSKENKKVALVLSGGGAKGEFQVGFLKGISNKKLNFQFSMYTGVSVGALNATFLAQHDDFPKAVENLISIWDGIKKNEDVYENPLGKFGVLVTLFTEKGIARDAIYNPRPLARLINQYVDWSELEKTKVVWAIGVVSLTDGRYYLISNSKKLVEEANKRYRGRLKLHLKKNEYGSIPDRVEDFVLASASMPLLFPPVDIYEHRFIDGGLRDVTPLSSVFLALSVNVEIDSIIVVNASPKDPVYRTAKELDSGQEIIERALELMVNEIIINDIDNAYRIGSLAETSKRMKIDGVERTFRKVDIYEIWPDRDFGLDSLEFSNEFKRIQLRNHGKQKGEEFAKNPDNFLKG